MYVSENFRTKAALRKAVLAGKKLRIWRPNDAHGNKYLVGTVTVCGPWFPDTATWDAKIELSGGFIRRVL